MDRGLGWCGVLVYVKKKFTKQKSVSLYKCFSVPLFKPLRCSSMLDVTCDHIIAASETAPGNPEQNINGPRPTFSLIKTCVTDATRFRNQCRNTQEARETTAAMHKEGFQVVYL